MTRVPVGPGSTLDFYVPFYFTPLTPMLYAVKKNNVQGYGGGQEPIVHLVSSVERIVQMNLVFVFTDGHPLSPATHFFSDLGYLGCLDWASIKAPSWAGSAQIKWRRQAEFLVYRQVPWTAILTIAVMTPQMQDLVRMCLAGVKWQPEVVVREDWYFLPFDKRSLITHLDYGEISDDLPF
jgi:hypothetical protein